MNTTTLPAGRYKIADPCYILSEEHYKQLLAHKFGKDAAPLLEIDGKKLVVFDTHHGDGIYYDQDDNEFWVDSGQIAAIPETLWSEDRGTSKDVVEYAEFVCSASNGQLMFGRDTVETNCSEEERLEVDG